MKYVLFFYVGCSRDVECCGLQQSGVGAGLGDMFGQLDLGSEEGEDQLMKMMQGMMSTLLSKEVLYPSLKELCKQVSLVLSCAL